jgi:hypothetical protein
MALTSRTLLSCVGFVESRITTAASFAFMKATMSVMHAELHSSRFCCASTLAGSYQLLSSSCPHIFLRYSDTLYISVGIAWKNDRYRPRRRDMCVLPRAGSPQKQMHILSGAMGKMLRGMELSIT